MKRALILTFVISLVFLSGCSFLDRTTDEQLKANTNDVVLSPGASFIIKPTVLGFGADIKAKISGDQGVKTVTVDSMSIGSSAKLSWEGKQKYETKDSKIAQEEYYDEYGSLPIGEKAPIPPEPIYEEKDINGKFLINNLSTSKDILMPEVWPEETITTDDNGVIFLSTQSFNELIENKKTDLSLGLTGNIFSQMKLYSYQAEEGVDKLKELVTKEEQESSDPPYELTAEDVFDKMKISINGEDLYIETIVSHNWFGEFVVLNNANYPLVLKMTPNPIAIGEGLDFKSLFGYQITNINY